MSLRALLRSETRTHHESIERRLAITEAIKSRQQYLRLIERFYGFYVAIEEKLSAFEAELKSAGIDLESRRKSSLLRRDLVSLEKDSGRAAGFERCSKLPELSTFSQVLGCLYVLEGSTLGGQVISRHFQKTLGIAPEEGGRFFFGYGADTGKMWGILLEQINSHGELLKHHSNVIKAACETFECLENWLVPPARTA